MKERRHKPLRAATFPGKSNKNKSMNDDWKRFEQALVTRGRNFATVEHATNRGDVIKAAGFTDPFMVACIETEWARRAGAPKPLLSNSTPTSIAAPHLAAVSAISTVEQFYNSPSELQEGFLVNEVYSALLDIDGTFIAAEDRSTYTVSAALDATSAALVTPILAACTAHKYVANQATWLQCESPSLVAQALGEGVRQLLNVYYARVGEIRQYARSGQETRILALVLAEAQRVAQPITFTEAILRDVERTVGGALLQALCLRMCRQTGNVLGEEILSLLLRHAVKPYLGLLNSWLTTGDLNRHLRDEFMVVDTLKEGGAVHEWESKFALTMVHCPSFLQRHANVILATGKYVRLLKGCGVKLEVPDIPLEYDPADPTPLTDAIDRAHDVTGRRVLEVLWKEHDLMSNYASLKRFWLANNGDWMSNFLDAAWDLLSMPKQNVKLNTLTSLLRSAISKSSCANDTFFEGISVAFASQSLRAKIASSRGEQEGRPSVGAGQTRSGSPSYAYEYIELEISPRWPLALMLNSEVIFKYNLLFRFVFLCKWQERRLQETWFKGPVSKLRHKEIYVAYALRQQMMHTLRQLQLYLHAVVIDPLWDVFEREARGASSVDAVLVAHNKFVEEAMVRLLMKSERFKTVAKLLQSVNLFCDYGQKFSSMVVGDNAEMALPEIKSITQRCEQSFHSALGELSSAKGPELVLLQPLLSWIDFSKYYEKKSVFVPTALES